MVFAIIGTAVLMGLLVIVAFVVILILVRNREEIDTIAINLGSEHYGGKSFAINVKKEIPIRKGNPNRLTRITGEALDLKPTGILGIRPTVELTTEDINIIDKPKGTLSDDVNVKLIIPKDADDIKKVMDHTKIGDILADYKNQAESKHETINMLTSTMKEFLVGLKSEYMGEINTRQMKKMWQVLKTLQPEEGKEVEKK